MKSFEIFVKGVDYFLNKLEKVISLKSLKDIHSP